MWRGVDRLSRVVRELPVADVDPSIELVAHCGKVGDLAHAEALVESDGGLVRQGQHAQQSVDGGVGAVFGCEVLERREERRVQGRAQASSSCAGVNVDRGLEGVVICRTVPKLSLIHISEPTRRTPISY